MLKTVNIHNFRLFEKFSIDNLAQVNLIVGKNNVGKSSLLEALYLLVSRSPRVLLELLKIRGEVSLTPANGSFRPRGYDVSHLFFGHQLQNEGAVSINSENGNSFGLKITFFRDIERLSLTGEVTEASPRRRQSPTFLRLEYQGSNRKFEVDVLGEVLDERHLRMYADSSLSQSNANYITTKGVDYDVLANLWDTITLTPKEDDVVKMLQILEPSVERISFQSRKTSNSGILVKYKGKDHPLPLGSMGDGMHRVLAIATALANSENGYLFIDEIDTGLHYRTITDMWNLIFKTAERLNTQVFATTHSSDCVASFDEAFNLYANRNAGKLFRLEQRKDKIVAVEYGADDLTIAIRQDIEVR